jgi:hypothetical protein
VVKLLFPKSDVQTAAINVSQSFTPGIASLQNSHICPWHNTFPRDYTSGISKSCRQLM